MPLLVLLSVGSTPVDLTSEAHFWPVVIAGGTAAVVATGLTLAGVRARDGRVILLGTAFSTTTALLMVHGFATPGVVVGMNGVIALAGGLSIPVGVGLLALTAIPGLRRPKRIAPLLVLQAVLAVGVLSLGAVALAFPSIVPMVPKAASPPAIALMVFGIGCLLVLSHRAVRTHTLTHRPADLLVVAGCAWLGVALFAQLWMGPGNVAFYGGHALEIGGIALIGIPTVLDLARVGASRPLVGDLTAVELVAAEEAYLGTRIRALLELLADRDASTEEHTRRVALLAARVAEELKLPACLRRDLAVGGLLHDVGKLSVPLEILQKPGPLDDAEFSEIRRHPEAGRKLLDELGGFPRDRPPAGLRPPRAARRHRLPERTEGRRAADRDPHPRGLRRLRRARHRSRLPRGVDARARARAAPGGGRHRLRPGGGERARARRHADRRRPVVGRRPGAPVRRPARAARRFRRA